MNRFFTCSYLHCLLVLLPCAAAAADLNVTMEGIPSPVLSGRDLTYTLTITNKSSDVARNIVVNDKLPSGTSYVSCEATGGGVCSGLGNARSVAFNVLPGGATAVLTLVANVDCSVPDGETLSNTVTVHHSKGAPDPEPSDNIASVMTAVSNPPPVISDLASDHAQLWPPGHRMVKVNIRYRAYDHCGMPRCSLGVESNEPVDGLGKGDIAPDWKILDAHHLLLRAERSPTGNGRVYTTTVQCSDSAGGTSSKDTAIEVPKNLP